MKISSDAWKARSLYRVNGSKLQYRHVSGNVTIDSSAGRSTAIGMISDTKITLWRVMDSMLM